MKPDQQHLPPWRRPGWSKLKASEQRAALDDWQRSPDPVSDGVVPFPGVETRKPQKPVLKGSDRMALLRALGHLEAEIRYNERDDTREIRYRGRAWEPLEELRIASLFCTIEETCVRPSGASAVFTSRAQSQALNALLDRFREDPFLEYLMHQMSVWDEKPRLDSWLPHVFAVDPECPFVKWTGRFIFAGAVRRAFRPGFKLDEMPILMGPGASGKSSVLAGVLPRKEWFGDTLNFLADDQRKVEALQGKVLVEAGELVGLHGSELANVKAFVSRQDDRFRLAFRRDPTSRLRRAIIVGTYDQSQPLPRDPAGNRRFVVVEVAPHPSGAKAVQAWLEANRDQLWAEATYKDFTFRRSGYTPALPDDLRMENRRRNDDYRKRDYTAEDAVTEYIQTSAHLLQKGQSMRAIAQAIGMVTGTGPMSARDQNRLGDALRQSGLVMRRVRKGEGRRAHLWILPEHARTPPPPPKEKTAEEESEELDW